MSDNCFKYCWVSETSVFKRPIQNMHFSCPSDLETMERDIGNIQKYLQDSPYKCFPALSSARPALIGPVLGSVLNWIVYLGLHQLILVCILSISVLYGGVVLSVLFFQTFLPYLEIQLHDGKSCKFFFQPKTMVQQNVRSWPTSSRCHQLEKLRIPRWGKQSCSPGWGLVKADCHLPEFPW